MRRGEWVSRCPHSVRHDVHVPVPCACRHDAAVLLGADDDGVETVNPFGLEDPVLLRLHLLDPRECQLSAALVERTHLLPRSDLVVVQVED